MKLASLISVCEKGITYTNLLDKDQLIKFWIDTMFLIECVHILDLVPIVSKHIWSLNSEKWSTLFF